jgi:hypothetical protein
MVYITTLTWLATAASELGARRPAGELYERLLPFDGRCTVMAGAVLCEGAISRFLMLLAALRGEPEPAARHYADAVALHERMGAVPLVARTHYEYARFLLDQGRADEALPLLDAARETAAKLGMPRLERAIDALTPVSGSGRFTLRRDGQVWRVVHGDRSFHVVDSKGLRYLDELVRRPGAEVGALDLVRAVRGIGPDEAAPASDAGELLDAQAVAAYRSRVADLRADLDEARAFHDLERAARIEDEIEFLSRELAAAVGLGGRRRKSASDSERARLNVTRAIRSAIRKIADHDPELGAHLDAAVTTGTFCAYRPRVVRVSPRRSPGRSSWRL